MPIRYAHTNLIAQDWRRLVAFYQTVFDCVPVPPERDQRGPWLERGTGVPDAHLQGMHLRLPGHGEEGPTLEIYSYSTMEERPEPRPHRKGFGHLAFEVDDVAATLGDVMSHGGRALGEVTRRDVPGVGVITFVYAADPEGNILELQNWA
jgi:predicted enzyme related to lactoylglutathione lyase